MDGPSLSQGASSPTDIIDTVEDKTHIEENLGDIAHNLTDKDDEALMPVDGVTTQKEDQVEEEEAPQEGRVSQMDSIGEDREELPQDSTARVSGSIISAESPPARRFSFIEGGRRPSTRSLPLQVDPGVAGSLLTEERFADRLEERLQQVLAEDVEHRLEDLAQYIQEEMYHFVLGPDMMERVRQEASNVLSIEMAVALAAQDKKMEDLVHSRVQSSLSEVTLTPEIPPEALSSLQQASEELNELADGLSKRVKLVEENVSELKGLRLQVPDMRNDIDTLQSNLAVCVQSIEELEVQQQELIAAGAKPSRNASPSRQLLSPSGSAADEVTAEDLAEHPEVQPVAVPEPISSPVPSPSQMASPETVKPKRRLSDMLGVYMPPAPKQPAVEDSQVQELVASTENMKNRLDQMEQLVGTETSSRRNSLQNKINDVDTLASILEDRMRELDNEFRSNHQKVQSQLDVLLAAHETQQAEDLRHNKTWNLANQVDVILSVINSEMRNLRSDFDQKLSSAIIGKPDGKGGDGTNEAPKGEVQDLEDKVKRLQDNQQQSMLKIAGLRSAHKHAEAQANFALEKLKRLQAEVGGIVDQVVAQQTRLDYLLVHGAAMQQSKDSSFKTIVSVGEQEKKPKLKGGATMPTRHLDKVPTDAGGPDVAKFDTTSDEVNASRIAKMGKRLLELDGEVNRTIVELRGEVQTVNKTLLAFLELLPRRLRRMLQRQLFPEQSEEDAGEIKVEFKSDEGKRHVTFGDQVETRTYTVEEDDSRLPWQLAGEPDIKWSWCFKPRDEMGKDLAMCLEQFETERDDFEAKIVQWLQHGGVPPPVASKGAPGWSRAKTLNQSDAMIGSFTEDAAVVAPQMMHMEDRIERLGSEFFNLKRAQDNDHVRKADKEEVQQLLARLTFFEKLNIPDLKIRIESLEGDTKFTAQNVSDMSEKLYKVESVAVPRSELVKVQNGFEDLRSDHQVMKMELKELSATTYNSNRKFTHEMAEAKTWTQQAVIGLQKNKADHPDVAQLSEKVGKLESSIKDNRRILGDGGGQEINAVVRRIILNLEDKIMVLEKKIDALADGRPKDTLQSKGDMSPSHHQCASYQSTEMQEAAVQSISEELSVMTEAVSKLKQDISVSKVHIDEMTEQGHQNLELASRLHVLVQSTALEGMDDEGTALSLTRVQVMIAAAARQLVAGSKWITKETFDSRMEQIRGEYFKEIRMMQGRLEDLTTKAQQAPLQVNMQAVPAKLPKMIFQKVQGQGQATPAQSEVDRLGTAPVGTRPQPMSARGLRPATEGRPRGRQGHQ